MATDGGLDGSIIIWDPTTGKPISQVRRGGWVRECALSSDGKTLFSCWTGDKLVFSDASTGQELHTVTLDDPDRPNTTQSGMHMFLSDDRETLVVFSNYSAKQKGEKVEWKTMVTGWDTTTRKLLFRRARASDDLRVAVSGDAKLLAAQQGVDLSRVRESYGMGPLHLEDLKTGAGLLTFPSLDGQTHPLSFSPDGRLLALSTLGPLPILAIEGGKPGEWGYALRIWEVATATELLALPTVINSRVAFSSDGSMLAVNASAQETLVWDLRRGKEIQRIKSIETLVTGLAFTPDGDRLVSGHEDSTLLIWDIAEARKAGRPKILDAKGTALAWADLAGDARTAFAARCVLTDSPAQAVPQLKERLKPIQSADAKRLRQLLADLDSDSFAVRDKARLELEEIGDLAAGALRQALTDNPSLEKRQRIQALLDKLRGPVTRPEVLRAIRAVAVLEDIATPEARQILQALAQGEPEARPTKEARASLERLARRATTKQ